MQRFGSYKIHTHEIGREVLRQDWTTVVRMLLDQHPAHDGEAGERKAKILKKVFEQGDIDGALNLLDRRDRAEKTLLLALRKQPHGYYNAFQCIPRNTRFIYLHAYQSYLWNQALSLRLKTFGCQVLVGDLAIPKEKAHLIEMEVLEEEAAEEDEEQAPPSKDYRDLVVDVTADNIHEFGIQQVVMPLVGYDTRMPANP